MRTYLSVVMLLLVSSLTLSACGYPATTSTDTMAASAAPTAAVAATATADTSGDQNKAILRRYYIEAYTNGNMAAVDDAIAYPDDFKAQIVELRRAFPNLKAAVIEQLAEDNTVLVVVNFSGTHKNTFRGVPATNKWLTWTAVNVHVMVDGECVGGSSPVPGDLQLLRELQVAGAARS